MKNYEKEAFIKTFLIFFIILTLFTTTILYFYYKEQQRELQNTILLQMKEYNYNFKNKNFTIDIIQKEKTKTIFKLYYTKDELYALFPIKKIENKLLKIIYPKIKYNKQLSNIKTKAYYIFIFITIFNILLSLAISTYVLSPMKKAIKLLDEFFKDIVHDLNTPITSILLNVKFLMKTSPNNNEELEKIELSAKRISSLYKNFQEISSPFHQKYKESINLKSILENRIQYFQNLYPNITFINKIDNISKTIHKDSFIRIIDNIISNSCKYNKQNGTVYITLTNTQLTIKDTGIGIKDTSKVFNRYYKETSRGIGLGLNIVQKLTKENSIKLNISSIPNQGTTITLTFAT